MNRDEIIRMAREAGIDAWWDSGNEHRETLQEHLEHFAGIVAAAERERMVADGWRQCAVGQRTTQFCGQVQAAVALEREEILKMSEAQWFRTQADYDAAIRARGQA